MNHLKGIRFGFAAVKRLGVIDDRENHSVKWNRHNGCELHYLLKGGYAWEIGNTGETISLGGGTFAVIPPRRKHRAAGPSGPTQRIGIILEPPRCVSTPEDIAFPLITGAEFAAWVLRFREAALRPYPITPRLSAALRELKLAVSEFSPDDGDTSLHVRLAVTALLFETYRTINAPPSALRGDDSFAALKRWIAAHLTEHISNNDLVRVSGYSRSRFFTLFYSAFGMTPKDYIVRERLALVKKLLASETRPPTLTALAAAVGFPSARALSTAYRRHTGNRLSNFCQC